MEYRYKPTTHGRNAIAACMALEKPFKITRVAFGSGKVDEDMNLADVHELLNYVSDGAVAERRHEDDRLYLTIQYANNQHQGVKTFLLSEFIVYCQDPETGENTDLLYGTLGDYRQPVPAYNPAFPPSEFNFPLTLIISDEINVSVSAPAGLVTYGDMADLIDGIAVRKAEITIPTTGWTGGGEGRYPYHLDVPVESAKERLIPALTVLPEGMESAVACGFAPFVQALDGAVRVFAASVPTGSIPANVTMQGDASAYCRVGTGDLSTVKLGHGLRLDPDGAISVDTASDAEINQMLAEVLSSDSK